MLARPFGSHVAEKLLLRVDKEAEGMEQQEYVAFEKVRQGRVGFWILCMVSSAAQDLGCALGVMQLCNPGLSTQPMPNIAPDTPCAPTSTPCAPMHPMCFHAIRGTYAPYARPWHLHSLWQPMQPYGPMQSHVPMQSHAHPCAPCSWLEPWPRSCAATCGPS